MFNFEHSKHNHALTLHTSTELKYDGAIWSKNQIKPETPDIQTAKANITYVKKTTILMFSEGEITWNRMLQKTKHIQNDS